MSTSVLYMSMSVDGYIAGPNDKPDNPGGDGFGRLHAWMANPQGEIVRPPGPAGELMDECRASGAIVAGRRTVEQVDHLSPAAALACAMVLSIPSLTYLTKNVLVHGAYTAQTPLEAGDWGRRSADPCGHRPSRCSPTC